MFSNNENQYSIITSGKILIIQKSTREIKELNTESYSPPFFVFKDRKNNYFLFGGKAYYQITFDKNGQIDGLKKVNKPISKIDNILFSSLNPECIGYIEEVENQNLLNLEGIRCEIKYDDE